MGPNERLFKKEYALELFRIAENDLLSGTTLSKVQTIRKETVLFHFEQAVEKALKSVLCHRGMPLPLTHDIYAIVQRFDPANLPPGGFALHDLTPFATVKRYEEGNYLIDENDILVATSTAQNVLNWAQMQLKQ